MGKVCIEGNFGPMQNLAVGLEFFGKGKEAWLDNRMKGLAIGIGTS